MLREKSAQRSPKTAARKPRVLTETATNETTSLIAREVLRILWLASSLFLVLSLVTYSPEDPALSTWSSKILFHNWMGRIGSIVSDICIQLFGAGSIAAVTLMFLLSSQIAEPTL